MWVAVHERALSLAVQAHDVARAFDVELGEREEALGQPVGVAVDGHAHELRATVTVPGCLRRDPREIAAFREAGRFPVPRVEHGKLLDDVTRAELDVGIVLAREAAADGLEILEHHDVAVVAGVRREQCLRDAHADFAGEVAEEARLGDTHSDVVHEDALRGVEGRQLDEHRCRYDALTRKRDAAPARSCPSAGRAPRRAVRPHPTRRRTTRRSARRLRAGR